VAQVSVDSLDRAISGGRLQERTAQKLERYVRTFEQPHPAEVQS
jgi:hypothetical protein